MDLFAADLFSDPVATTSPALPARAGEVERLLAAHYQKLGDLAGAIAQFGGAELNSKNFLADVGGRRFVVKCVDQPLDAVIDVAAYAQWVHSASSAVPRVYDSDDGAPAVRFVDRSWYVLEHVAGAHFSGLGQEPEQVAARIAALSEALARSPRRPGRVFPTLAAEDAALAEELQAERGRWPSVLGEETAALLTAHWDDLRGQTAEVLQEVEASGLERGVMHIDLHPHNLVVPSRGAPLFLDLDSFQVCAPAIALAFGCLKLLRQAVVAREIADASARRDLAQRFVDDVGADTATVGLFSRSEILRRIFVLLRLSLRANDRSWNHVLPVHLRTLAESRALFR